MQTDDVVRLFVDLDVAHWGGRLRAGGWRCGLAAMHASKYGHALRDHRLIEIAEWLLGNPAELRRTLVHEMIHAWLYMSSDPSHQCRNEGHGAAFAAELARVGAAGEDVAGESRFVVCGDTSEDLLRKAAECFLARQARRSHPDGRFNKAGCWYPNEPELQDCCARIREPSKNYPYNYLTHCRTATHISRLFGVDTVTLRKTIAQAKREPQEAPCKTTTT